MNLDQYLDALRGNRAFMSCVTHWETLPAQDARYMDLPLGLSAPIVEALKKRGIYQLYTHQRQAVDAALAGENVTIVTPTASGKTYCYNLPVLETILRSRSSRALYLFPTKALAADQNTELNELIRDMGEEVKAFTYDGDTPVNARNAVRLSGHIVITNPDMLHSGILPHHTKWVKLFENLKYVVIDEIHAYRGIFGSNLANVIRRLKRICAFYGSHPQFICCSATIANPGELAARLTGETSLLVDKSGAPMGTRHVIFYNPPVVNRQLGIRSGSVASARKIASSLLQNDIYSITFARSRLNVEVLTTYLKRLVRDALGNDDAVRGYRGGYLPTLRRDIERGLRDGSVKAVVSTNALELGIDIGQLEACVLCGYPGSVASTWQQAGRAGRRKSTSVTFLVASSAPQDQYIITHPEYFFQQSPEHALINPDNLYVMLNHLKCAAYELPFTQDELFGGNEGTQDMLQYLEEEHIVHLVGGRYHWMAEEFPASDLSLRTALDENFVIIDITNPQHHEVIGEMDRFTVPMLLHDRAIYIHNAMQYQVEKLDFQQKRAYIKQVDVDYYTDADLSVSLRVLDEFKNKGCLSFGEVLVSSLVTMFKKMKFDTHENIGYGEVNLPELEMHTTAAWMTLTDELFAGMEKEDAQGGMAGIAHALSMLAPLYLMCASWDIQVRYHVRDPYTDRPTLYLYDSITGGVGLADKAYDMMPVLLQRAKETIETCPCKNGCPSCIGVPSEHGKEAAVELLRRMIDEQFAG